MEQAAALMQVLVIDDNEDGAMMVAELLRMRGHTVEVATSGSQGVEAANLRVPDVVLLDIGMPIMDGYQVAERLRQSAFTRAIRLVALTAWGDNESKARALSSGFDFHLVKPANFEALFDAIEVGCV